MRGVRASSVWQHRVAGVEGATWACGVHLPWACLGATGGPQGGRDIQAASRSFVGWPGCGGGSWEAVLWGPGRPAHPSLSLPSAAQLAKPQAASPRSPQLLLLLASHLNPGALSWSPQPGGPASSCWLLCVRWVRRLGALSGFFPQGSCVSAHWSFLSAPSSTVLTDRETEASLALGSGSEPQHGRGGSRGWMRMFGAAGRGHVRRQPPGPRPSAPALPLYKRLPWNGGT